MRLFVLLLLMVGFSLSACKKYNLKQPSHLSLRWKVVNNNSYGCSVQNAFLYASSIDITGVRKEGSDISLSQPLPNEKITVSEESLFTIKVDVPMGDYTSLQAKISMVSPEGSNFGINGNANVMGTPVKFKVDFAEMEEIIFNAISELEFKKKKEYDLYLCLDINKLLQGVTQQDWDESSVALEPTGPSVLIQEIKNHHIFTKVRNNLPNAIYIATY